MASLVPNQDSIFSGDSFLYPPKNAICHGEQNDNVGKLWSVIANTPHGKIPG